MTVVEIHTAATAQEAEAQLAVATPAVLVMDLSLPAQAGACSRIETGHQLLGKLMATYPDLNLVVHSAYARSLIRLKPAIDNHQGGFTIADKNLPVTAMLEKVDWALKGPRVHSPRPAHGP